MKEQATSPGLLKNQKAEKLLKMAMEEVFDVSHKCVPFK